jgi:glyoxylase-like metal-dependent hydrolase (beta-lactamase superfamily II)
MRIHHHDDYPLRATGLRDFDHGIYAVDSGYLRDELDAVHLLVEKGRVAIIDTSTERSVPRTLAALESLGLSADCVDFIVLTHVHLDHAGGAGALMAACPQAKLTVHPRGLRHMLDPSQLWAAVCAVYGEEMALREYGPLSPVAEDRIIVTPEGASISLAGRSLEFWDAPGHARHHVFIRDTQTGGIFTGDTFGISYRELDTPKGSFIFVTCPPTQFEPEPLKASISRVMAAAPPAVYLTHYSQVRDVQAAGAQLLKQVDQYVALALARKDHGEGRARAIEADLHQLIQGQARAMGVTLDDKTLGEVLALDMRLNADGLSHWLERL